jgi:hypothetical protein
MAAAPLSKYAAPVEVKMLAKAMRQRWKSMGRDSRSLSKDSHAYWKRKCIERGLKALRRGELPIHIEDCAGGLFSPLPCPLYKRRDGNPCKLQPPMRSG